ncbi:MULTISPECIES: RNA-guided endonuclease TnpB family protein [unclassified Nonomuraea]|uniref:RNA-guided endonuclease InsQ/TnpB family protein n=1 Tax=unclassified Nonomuraea TaxID=2593643 RepID=UPI0033E25778
MTDILTIARAQVLDEGVGLDREQALECLRLPGERLGELLAPAHEVRMKWCGPEVEVEGIVSVKTGGCPEDCHFCSQPGQFSSPVRAVWLRQLREPLDIVWSRPLPEGAEPSTVTVCKDASGRWFVSILVEETIRPLGPAEKRVGVDAGITALATLSTGETIANPKHERADRRKLARAQRDLARKAKGSANRQKARLKLARIHARITDRRRDFLHKLTTRLVRENQTVVIEDLTVRNMVKNHSLARAVCDASWRQMRAMLEYKTVWYGRELVVIDRWFPSSKMCSTCGTLQEKMPLAVRAWHCACGALHDRDVNAAINILAAGLAER